MKIGAKLTAHGEHKGRAVVVCCIRYYDEPQIKVIEDGKDISKEEDRAYLLERYSGERCLGAALELSMWIIKQIVASGGERRAGYLPFVHSTDSLYSYWCALQECGYFDEPPLIEIEGDFNPEPEPDAPEGFEVY